MWTVLSGILAVWAAIMAIVLLAGKPTAHRSSEKPDETRRKPVELAKVAEVLTQEKFDLYGAEAAMRGTDNLIGRDTFPSQSQAAPTDLSKLAGRGVRAGRA